MKVLYIITSTSNGLGGHYRSLDVISTALGTKINYSILFIGYKMSPIYENKKNIFFIDIQNSYVILKKEINNIIYSYRPTHIHAFDIGAYLLATISEKHLPIIYTKCGGPNSHIPYCKSTILFTQENAEYAKKDLLNKIVNPHIIPNRISDFSQDNNLINELRNKINYTKDDFIILEIVRIYPDKKGLIEQTLKLHSFLKKELLHKTVKLVFVGDIIKSDFSDYFIDKIQKDFKKEIFIISDKKFTIDAKKIISAGDLIVGAGRSVMETFLYGNLIFSHTNNKLPVLINEQNFHLLLNYNFSNRSIVKDEFDIYNFTDKEKLENLKFFYKDYFQKYFSMNSVIQKYLEIYTNAVSISEYTFKERFYLIIDQLYYIIKFKWWIYKSKKSVNVK